MKKQLYTIITCAIILSACTPTPKKIAYGKDNCHYCKMTVVDKTHSAQYVTKKGKVFVFDAIECLANTVTDEQNEPTLAHILVADYQNPGTLIDARNAAYIISKEIKSPMGAYLSAVSNKTAAKNLKETHGGTLYNWETLKVKFSN